MTAAGFFVFAVSWGLIIGLSAYCMYKVLRLKESQAEHIHPIHEIDTGDLGEKPSGKDEKKG